MEIKNKKAYFDYFIDQEIEAGIALKGSEIKSVRKGSVALKDSYIRIKNNEAFIINMFIDQYNEASIFNHNTTRERKLLLHKKEIKKLDEYVRLGSNALVPLKLYLLNGKVKILIGVARGKKMYDKRESIKEKDVKRIEKRMW